MSAARVEAPAHQPRVLIRGRLVVLMQQLGDQHARQHARLVAARRAFLDQVLRQPRQARGNCPAAPLLGCVKHADLREGCHNVSVLVGGDGRVSLAEPVRGQPLAQLRALLGLGFSRSKVRIASG